MGPLLLGGLIGGGAGLLSHFGKKSQADKERQYQAQTAKWSPWTGLQSHYVQDPSFVGDVLGGAASGLSFGAMNQGALTEKGVAPEMSSSNYGPLADKDEYMKLMGQYKQSPYGGMLYGDK